VPGIIGLPYSPERCCSKDEPERVGLRRDRGVTETRFVTPGNTQSRSVTPSRGNFFTPSYRNPFHHKAICVYPCPSVVKISNWCPRRSALHWLSVLAEIPKPQAATSPASATIRNVPVPELLAPAGDWECAKAAVENGADAIYFGLERFNARMRAHNFTEADLPKLMEFLHSRGVKGYVTFNTLVFANELAEAERYIRTIIAAGVDAAIVQDIGICRLIRQLSPDFPIHASTQMTVTSAAGVEFAKDLGCNLVVLARECSIKEIESIVGLSTLDSRPSTLPLEVFVHGALCVAYSGQCLTSEALGGRSANRGECAQACRMPYDLISDGQQVDLGDRRYLLSPQDLAGMEVLPDLVRSGVTSLKIEGRLKTPEYVANITRVYRRALDQMSGRARLLPSLSADEAKDRVTPSTENSDRYNLEMGFSRGLYTGWFGGINNQQLVHARFGKKRGVYLGEVRRTANNGITLVLEAPLKRGDGVVFDAGHPDQKEEGGRVYDIRVKNNEATLFFGDGDVDFSRIKVGDKLWKTSDPELDRELRKTFSGDAPQFTRALNIEVHGQVDAPMTVIARDEMGHIAQQSSAMHLQLAQKQPLTTDRLRDQLGRLGGTPFHLGQLENKVDGTAILPMSELNRIRRDLVAEIARLKAEPKRWTLNDFKFQIPASQSSPVKGDTANLIVLVRSIAQLEAAISSHIQTIYCEFEDPKKYRDAVSLFRKSEIRNPKSEIFVAPPRIAKTGEEWILKQVRSSNADGYLVRNYDDLKFFADCRRIGDFSLNVANPITAQYFKEKFGLERLTASYDLNVTQLDALLKSAPPEWFEITIHQHMPMFHMEHCVFCAFLSKGTDYKNCGRPCDTKQVKLRDRVGLEHPLKADAGCRNTVFNARAQTGAEYASHMLDLGVQNFRIEFVNETPNEVATTIAKYRSLLRGEISGSQLWRELKLHNQLGVTRGTLT
jgi:putative protease